MSNFNLILRHKVNEKDIFVQSRVNIRTMKRDPTMTFSEIFLTLAMSDIISRKYFVSNADSKNSLK